MLFLLILFTSKCAHTNVFLGFIVLQDCVVHTLPTNRLCELKPPTHTEEEFKRIIKKLDTYNALHQQLMGTKVSNRGEVKNKMFAGNIERINIDAIIKKTPDQLPYLFEGDMVMTDEQMDVLIEDVKAALSNTSTRQKRSMILGEKFRWKTMPIKYYINSTMKVNERAVLSGVKRWEDETCVTFERVTDKDLETIRLLRQAEYDGCSNANNETDILTVGKLLAPNCKLTTLKPYSIEFIKGVGCYSSVGNVSRYGQVISIGNGCTSMGIVSHEIGHALGFYHEQSRPDRDDYITVAVENIVRSYIGQFSKRSWSGVNSYGVAYDFGSVMHYGASNFKIGNLKTIFTKDSVYQNTIGQRSFGPSFNDVKKINLAYCSTVCKTPLLCENFGYPDPKDCSKCRCPGGFGGTLCGTAAKTSSNCGGITLYSADDIQEISQQGRAECNFMIKAPIGHVVHFEITSACFTQRQLCGPDFLEIKYWGDLGKAGARVCGIYPKATASQTNTVMVTYNGGPNSSFSMVYKSHNPILPLVPLSDAVVINECGPKKATTSTSTSTTLTSTTTTTSMSTSKTIPSTVPVSSSSASSTISSYRGGASVEVTEFGGPTMSSPSTMSDVEATNEMHITTPTNPRGYLLGPQRRLETTGENLKEGVPITQLIFPDETAEEGSIPSATSSTENETEDGEGGDLWQLLKKSNIVS